MRKLFENKNYALAMLLSILLYTLLFISNKSAAKVFEAIFILGSLPIFFYHKETIFKDPMVKLLGLVLLMQLINWLHTFIFQPELASSAPKIDRLGKLFSFIFIAYWLKGNLRNVFALWATLSISFICACFLHHGFFNEVITGLAGARVDFEIKNAQFTSMFSGISLLISSFFLIQITYNKKPFNSLTNTSKILLILFVSIAFCFFALITIITQSRQVWLALSLTLLLSPVFYILIYKKPSKKIITISILLIPITFITLSQLNEIKNRVSKESTTLQHLISGDFDNIPMTSIGVRVNSWIAAVDWIKAHPLIGSGPEAIPQVIQQSGKFTEPLKKRFGHLHNYHIETLVAYGVIGLSLVYALYYWLSRSLFIRKTKEPELVNIYFFSLIFITFWGTINLFETFNGRSFGIYVHNIMFAGFYTFYLTTTINNKDA